MNLNRRKLLLSGATTMAVPAIGKFSPQAWADGAVDPSRLQGDLTPLGAERAASASGHVPAWTGGQQLPPGYDPSSGKPPELFTDESPLFTVTVDNMAQYADMLTEGQQQMLKRFGPKGHKLNVYQTHRTANAPQEVYDNTALNVTRAQPGPGGYKYGFTGAVGGIPFPILSADPAEAGAQAMWNHQLRWSSYEQTFTNGVWVIGGGRISLSEIGKYYGRNNFYKPGITPDTYNGHTSTAYYEYVAPPSVAGAKFLITYSSQPWHQPDQAWSYLVGEGRVRQAPSADYDTPSTNFDDAINQDESYGFLGAQDRYDWKLLGKKEMIIPYNHNKLYFSQPEEVIGLDFINPDVLRYEIHRVWEIEARLSPGKRMTEPLRRFWLDEDTWIAVLFDSYDDQGNFWKTGLTGLMSMPQLPGTIYLDEAIWNFQSNNYVFGGTFFNAPYPLGTTISFATQPSAQFDHNSMVNSGGL